MTQSSSLASSTMSTSSTTSSSSIIFPQNQLVSVKLDETNFLIWKQQISTTIKWYGLEDFISGTTPAPAKFITPEGSQKKVLNPDFLSWQRQDQILALWILSSLSESILVTMVGLSSSVEIWSALETNFASQSQAKLMQYKLKLQTLKKGDLSMREYLNKVKNCCDVLASTGHKVSETEYILHILSGLGAEYNPVMVSVTSRFEPGSLLDSLFC
ncbi:hypothetical protein DH2020_023623 [Rehmannia glutinosa]|uniref:Retrotransposon Copia-like N-terminal domain-containing protein n=1 Tax=Rehmannia glutinosa TaxID=99300 RepID=A0ABR0WAR7_REHGL